MNTYSSEYHVPVLWRETLEALRLRPDGLYLDGTAGGGGHSLAIASRLTSGHLYALDQDPDAVAEASARLQGLPASVFRSNFTQMRQVLTDQGVCGVDGILLDIGVSSHQLDTAERGFSFHMDAPLDMRMSQDGPTAADLINTLPTEQLIRLFREYGEEKFAGPIARAVVRERERHPLQTTLELAELIKSAVPAAARRDGHPARRVFQALRIEVNHELDCLKEALITAFDCLNPHGRLAVITFHSLEDRLVKERFAQWKIGCICPPSFPVCVCHRTPPAKVFKPVTAGENELAENPRCRSAKLRYLEKLHDPYFE